MAKREQQTFYNVKTTTADGQTQFKDYVSEKQFTEMKAEGAKVSSIVEDTKAQTFVVTTAESLDEILQVVPNDEVALNYFNYGLSLAQHNVKRELMKDEEWQPVEGVYDLLPDVQLPKERRVADPLATARRSLRAMWVKNHPGSEPPTDDAINAVLAQFAGAADATTA